MEFSGKGKAALGCKNQHKDGTNPDNPSGSSRSMRPLVYYSRQPEKPPWQEWFPDFSLALTP